MSDDRGSMGNSNWMGNSNGCMSDERGSMGNSKRGSMGNSKRSSMGNTKRSSMSNTKRSSMSNGNWCMSEEGSSMSHYWSTMESMSSMRDKGTMSTNHLVGANKGGWGSSSQTSKGSKHKSLPH